MSDKTEEPTPRRLRKAATQGDVPVSGSLVSISAFFTAVLLVPAAIADLASWSVTTFRRVVLNPPTYWGAASEALWAVAIHAAPLLAASAAMAALVGAAQAGGVFALSQVVPQLERLSVLQGLRNLVRAQRLFGIARALVTCVAVALIVRAELTHHAEDLAASLGAPSKAAFVATELSKRVVYKVSLVLLAAALVDVAITRRSWRQRLRMSREEIKREAKESEGDPHLKAARERAHHELLMQAAIHAVKDATVVVVNPTRLAAALRYREGEEDAPSLIAKGEGALAAQIVQAARAYGVPVVQDIPLARALLELEAGDEIPEALYETVAEVLRTLWEEAEKEPLFNEHLLVIGSTGSGDPTMKDRAHDEAMAELFRENSAFAIQYLNEILEEGDPT